MDAIVGPRAKSPGRLAFEARVAAARPAITAWLREQPVEMAVDVTVEANGRRVRTVRPATDPCGICARRRALLTLLGVPFQGLVLLDADQSPKDKGGKWENEYHDYLHLGVGLAAVERIAFETRCTESRASATFGGGGRVSSARAMRGSSTERAVDAMFGFGLSAEQRRSVDTFRPEDVAPRGKAARTERERARRKGKRFSRKGE